MDFTRNELISMFTFLDNLRESGATNMFGAAMDLVVMFDLEKKEARAILAGWMETFDGESTVEDRVDSFIQKLRGI